MPLGDLAYLTRFCGSSVSPPAGLCWYARCRSLRPRLLLCSSVYLPCVPSRSTTAIPGTEPAYGGELCGELFSEEEEEEEVGDDGDEED